MSIADVLSQSDIVSPHVPLTEDTKGLIDSSALARMKKDAYLINTARGPVVNESHLVKALQDGQIRGAALDKYEVEPPPIDSPLYQLHNVVMTMHTAGNTDFALRKMGMNSVRNVLSVLRNEPLDRRMVVNKEKISEQTMRGGK